MRWMKVDEAREYCGRISRQTIYDAHRRGLLKAAHVGAGRNLLFCEQWLDEYLTACAHEAQSDKAVRS